MNKSEAIERLREYVNPGDTVYCILRNVARSGMSCQIGFVVFRDGIAYQINGMIANAFGYRLNKNHDGVTVSGCGMDMGFAVVYDISMALFGDGYAIKYEWL